MVQKRHPLSIQVLTALDYSVLPKQVLLALKTDSSTFEVKFIKLYFLSYVIVSTYHMDSQNVIDRNHSKQSTKLFGNTLTSGMAYIVFKLFASLQVGMKMGMD